MIKIIVNFRILRFNYIILADLQFPISSIDDSHNIRKSQFCNLERKFFKSRKE